MHWNILNPTPPHSLDELRTILLKNRDLTDSDTFFHPPHPSVLTPTQMGITDTALKKAVKRILKARDTAEQIVIFGDYDADGVSATAVLWQALHLAGCQVQPFIPQRDKHGYGLSVGAVEEIIATHHPKLIITVDNGIVAHVPAQRVKDESIDLIISDHHQPEGTAKKPVWPPAYAIVHSTQLCGTTVAWVLARAVLQEAGVEIPDDWQLDLAAIATIADQVPLREVNRSFAYHGLPALRTSKRLGLQALLKQADIEQSELTSQSIGFAIAPRINAMGRLGSSLDALRLLLTTNPLRAEKLASVLGQTNARRQDLTYELFDHAMQQAKNWENEHIIIVHSDQYHEGIIGLIAGRLMEKFYKPAIAMSVGEKTIKASARSIAGVNIVELIREVQSDLLEVGGHPMAAGFGLETAKLELVTGKLQTLARTTIAASLLEPAVIVDTLLPTNLVSQETATMLEQFAPFGQGNPQPVFGFKDLEIVQVMTMGKDNQHLKIVAKEPGSDQLLYFLAWRKGELSSQLQPGATISIAGVLEINRWKGRVMMQVRVEDLMIDLQ